MVETHKCASCVVCQTRSPGFRYCVSFCELLYRDWLNHNVAVLSFRRYRPAVVETRLQPFRKVFLFSAVYISNYSRSNSRSLVIILRGLLYGDTPRSRITVSALGAGSWKSITQCRGLPSSYTYINSVLRAPGRSAGSIGRQDTPDFEVIAASDRRHRDGRLARGRPTALQSLRAYGQDPAARE